MKLKFYLLLLFMFTLGFSAWAQNNDLNTVYSRCRELLLSDTAYATERSFRLTDDVKFTTDAAGYFKSLQPDGNWKDIEYNRPDIPSAWPAVSHLYRLMLLCRAWNKSNDAAQLQAIHRAMAFFIKNDFQCNNWWQNQINVPYVYSSLLIMLDAAATADERRYLDKLIPRVQQKNPTGQNKIWQHDAEARIALIQRNPEAFNKVVGDMQSVIKISTAEGIQPDNSFHQHGAMLQFGNYGLHFVNSLLFWLRVTEATPYAFLPEKRQILLNYCADGLKWTVYKGAMDVLATGRQLRENYSPKRGDNLNANFSLLRAIDPDSCRYVLDGLSKPNACVLAGNKGFWRSDYMVQLAADRYMMSVKTHGTFSKRVESINGENQLGAFLNDGVALVQRSGNEYRNIEVAWRWNMLPGTTSDTTWIVTSEAVMASNNQSAFVGQVSDGAIGASAMVYDRLGLKAHKSYFFVADMMVALGAGISAADMQHVVTTVDQRLYNYKTKKQIKGENWFWHGGSGYFFPDKTNLPKFKIEKRVADWSAVDKFSSVRKFTDSVATWHISHAQSDKYAYMVKPAAGLVETHKMVWKLPVRIITNTALVQAVRTNDVMMAVFYQPGSFYVNEGIRIGADQPCMLICRKVKGRFEFWVSDPSRKLQQLNVTVGKTVIPVRLPQEDMAGSTVQVAKD